MNIPNGDQWAAAFLASEPEYDEPAWVDAYAMAIGRCMPQLEPDEATALAVTAYERDGLWNNPKIAAGLDAVFGPLVSMPPLSREQPK